MQDVVVMGGGNAAVSAALMARESEQAYCSSRAPREWCGGNMQHMRNLRCMHNGPQDVLVLAYTEEKYCQDLSKVTGGLSPMFAVIS